MVWLRWSPVLLGTTAIAIATVVAHAPSVVIQIAMFLCVISWITARPLFVIWTTRLGATGVQTKSRPRIVAARRFRLHLHYILDRAELTVRTETRDRDGRARTTVERPKLKKIASTAMGLTFTLRVVPGRQTVASFSARADALASVLGLDLKVAPNISRPTQLVDVAVRLQDTLAVSREAKLPDASEPDSISGQIRVGRLAEGGDLSLNLFEHHTAVQGQNRSGKSAFVYGLLANCAANPLLLVVGCDPSSLTLAPFRDAPHPEWRGLGTMDMATHSKALVLIVAEMDRRLSLLLAMRRDKLNSTDLSPSLPHVLVVLEEFAGLVISATASDRQLGAKPNERVSASIEASVTRLLQEGAKVSITVLTVLQRAEASVLVARSQYARRISFRVDNVDSLHMLHPALDPGIAQEVRSFVPGMALIDQPGCPIDIFRSDLTSYTDYADSVFATLNRQTMGP